MNKPDALSQQVGGHHYKDWVIQPFEFFWKNNLPFHKADIIKRIMRYDRIGDAEGLQDLEKIIHECQMLIQLHDWEKGA